MFLFLVVLLILAAIGCITVACGIKKRSVRQQKEIVDEWSREVNALCLVTEKAAKQELPLASKTLYDAGIWFDIATKKLHLPENVFWSLGAKNSARTLVTIFKACIKENINNDEPENSANNQRIINACIEGFIKALVSRARTDPKEALGVMNILAGSGQSPEDSIHKLLLSPKPDPK